MIVHCGGFHTDRPVSDRTMQMLKEMARVSRASQYVSDLKMRGFEKDESLDAWVRRDESGTVIESVSCEWLALLGSDGGDRPQ